MMEEPTKIDPVFRRLTDRTKHPQSNGQMAISPHLLSLPGFAWSPSTGRWPEGEGSGTAG